MLESLPKMLLGLSPKSSPIMLFSVLLWLHYTPKLVRFVAIILTSECSIRVFYYKVAVLLVSIDLAIINIDLLS